MLGATEHLRVLNIPQHFQDVWSLRCVASVGSRQPDFDDLRDSFLLRLYGFARCLCSPTSVFTGTMGCGLLSIFGAVFMAALAILIGKDYE